MCMTTTEYDHPTVNEPSAPATQGRQQPQASGLNDQPPQVVPSLKTSKDLRVWTRTSCQQTSGLLNSRRDVDTIAGAGPGLQPGPAPHHKQPLHRRVTNG